MIHRNEILALLFLTLPGAAAAQLSPVQLEVNLGAAVPVQEFSGPEGFEGEAGMGTSFGVHFVVTERRLSWYAGFSEHRFACPADTCVKAEEIVSTGWDVGVRLNLLRGPVVPWVRAGLAAYISRGQFVVPPSAEPSGVLVSESDRGWGFEAGAGILISIAPRFALNPGVRYASVDPTFAGSDLGRLDSRYVVADLGLVLVF